VGHDQARVANMLLLTLRGTPTCYYGDEIGMANVPIPPEKIQDPPALNQPEIAHLVGRDPERTPMQWDDSPNAGFAAPAVNDLWLPLAADYAEVNVSRQLTAPRSMLSFYRRLLAYRKATPALQHGSYRSVDGAPAACFAYLREAEGQKVLVALNFSSQEQKLSLPQLGSGHIAVSTQMDREGAANLAGFSLRGNEGLIIQLDA
jgi:alpha-glucosidase